VPTRTFRTAGPSVLAALSATLVFLLVLEPGPARSETSSHETSSSVDLSDDQLEQRTEFLIERLEARQRYAKIWYRAWFATYSVGIVGEGVRAGLVSGENARTDHLVGLTKSAIALTELLFRKRNARFGADPVLAMPDRTREDRLARLERAEELLRSNARRARERSNWVVHASNFAINAIGAGVLLAVDADGRAAVSGAVGLVFGELAIWTEPAKPAKDWEEYERRFGDGGEPVWSIVPAPGGLALQVLF